MSQRRRTIITCTLLVCSYFIAITAGDADKVLGFVGSTASTSICYILPGLFYYKLHQNSPWNRTKIGAVVLFFVGIILVPLLLTLKILEAVGINLSKLK